MGRETNQQRRALLGRLCCTLAAGGAGALLPQLNLMAASLSAAPKGSSYRGLVCVNLSGGSDSFNMLIPRDSSRHAQYLTARGGVYDAASNGAGLGIAQSALLPIAPGSGGDYGLHPSFADFTSGSTAVKGLATRFSEQRVAFLANIGTLLRPISKAEYSNPANRPPQLYSHNDQTNLWHLGRTDSNFNRGWGGQVADRVTSLNTNPDDLSACISISGSNRFQVGAQVFPYQMGTGGPVAMNSFNGSTGSTGARRAALDAILAASASAGSLMSQEYSGVHKRALDLYASINGAINSTIGALPVATPIIPLPANNSLASQLAVVARMIKARGALGMNRQVFYVSHGGFDTHDAQMGTGTNGQPQLFTRLNQAIGWFYAELEAWDLAQGTTLVNDVMGFTMSEFGRTLNSNGNGTDHAWGANQLVFGKDVVGGRIYGSYPELLLDGPISFSRGQMIPSTSVDQMAATLGRWMGLTPTDLSAIFPNIGNFATANLGFAG